MVWERPSNVSPRPFCPDLASAVTHQSRQVKLVDMDVPYHGIIDDRYATPRYLRSEEALMLGRIRFPNRKAGLKWFRPTQNAKGSTSLYESSEISPHQTYAEYTYSALSDLY